MANSSGFVDFSQEMAGTGDAERRLLEQALARAEEATGKSQQALRNAERDAGGRYGADGQLTGEESSLSQSASYSDYLSAKGAAKAAWEAVASENLNPRSVRGVLQGSMGVGGRMRGVGEDLAAREDAAGGRLETRHAALETHRAQRIADAEAKRAAAAERERVDREQNTQMSEYYRQMMAPGGEFKGGMNYASAAQRYLALQQRAGEHGWDSGGFDPNSRSAANGLEVRSMAYGDATSPINREQRTQAETRWGNYGIKPGNYGRG